MFVCAFHVQVPSCEEDQSADCVEHGLDLRVSTYQAVHGDAVGECELTVEFQWFDGLYDRVAAFSRDDTAGRAGLLHIRF